MTDTRIIDMHVHSSASDGTFSPALLLSEAKKAGLSAMALTDHDTMDEIEDAAPGNPCTWILCICKLPKAESNVGRVSRFSRHT